MNPSTIRDDRFDWGQFAAPSTTFALYMGSQPWMPWLLTCWMFLYRLDAAQSEAERCGRRSQQIHGVVSVAILSFFLVCVCVCLSVWTGVTQKMLAAGVSPVHPPETVQPSGTRALGMGLCLF